MEKLPQLTNHAPVSAAIFAGALSNILIAYFKGKYGLDLAGQESELQLVIMGAVGYLVKGA